MTINAEIGIKVKSKEPYHWKIEKNTEELIKNHILLDKQGSGKTNLLMSMSYEIYSAYNETEAKFGALPIIFSPFFEWTKLRIPSKFDNMSKNREPDILDSEQMSFELANPVDPSRFRMIAFDFNDLNVYDIASLINKRDNKSLGKIKKCLRDLRFGWKGKTSAGVEIEREGKEHPTIYDFLEIVEVREGISDDLFFVFSELEERGFFDVDKYWKFDWWEILRLKKPLVFNFGAIPKESPFYQAIAGYLLRKLMDISQQYLNATLKSEEHKNNPNSTITLTDDEKFLVKNFQIALIFEEAHRFFPNTKATEFLSYPAIMYYKDISRAVGRKQGFKYSFLISQEIMMLCHALRKLSGDDEVFLGSKLGTDDREYLHEIYKVPDETVSAMVSLPKYSWAVFRPTKFQNKRKGFVSQFKAYRSPVGVPK